MASKAFCVICNKGIGQFKCEGCSEVFCMKHVTEHRQTLSQQLDEVIFEHDIIQQTIMEEKTRKECLMTSIAQWEKKSIEQIQQIAEDVREKVNQLEDTFQSTVRQELDQLKEQIRKAREEDDFFENDLRIWLVKLEQLKALKTEALSNTIKEDPASALVHQIAIFSVSSNGDSFKRNLNNRMYTINEVKIPQRLQYTNQDGIYVNPRSSGVTPIWYFYSPQYKGWFWTPYQNYEIWMSVENLIVKSGYYKDRKPATINIEIIQYLQQNNPLPPEEIIREASKAENRILKL